MKPTDEYEEPLTDLLRQAVPVPVLDDLAAERLARQVQAAAAPHFGGRPVAGGWQAELVGVGRYSVPLAAAAGLVLWLLAGLIPGLGGGAAAENHPAAVFLAAVEGSATGEMVVDAALGTATTLTLSGESR